MVGTGYVDWHRLSRTRGWADTRQGRTFVVAYWLADYGRTTADHGLGLFKTAGSHPDWFLHAEYADRTLLSVLPDGLVASPNLTQVYDTHLTSRPLLTSVLLGTASEVFAADGRYWWCAANDLTRPGRRLLKQLSMLYLRPPVVITFLETPADD